MSGTQYYRPYTNEYDEYQSDNDSESGSESSTSTSSTISSSYENTIARGTDDPRYAIIRAAGPSLVNPEQQMYYQKGNHTENYGYPYVDWTPPRINDTVDDRTLNTYFPASKATQTSLFSISSANRDKNVYPNSTYFTLKTPRTYKNITQIQVVNINFPYFLNQNMDLSGVFTNVALWVSSNYGINYANCGACLGQVGRGGVTSSMIGGSFSEYGRISPTTQTHPLIHTYTLSPGDYMGPQMAAELNKQMNLTPPFNIISYAEHRQIFLATKTVDHLFNTGGKWYYSVSRKSYLPNVSRDVIRDDYIPQVLLEDPTSPTEREVFVAYFYPVLKQAFTGLFDHKFLDFGSYMTDEVESRVMVFEGLSSPFYYELTYLNRSVLKSMRRQGTFEYFPIHSYNWTFNYNTQKLSVQHSDLHPSLQSDIQNTMIRHKCQEIEALGYSGAEFQGIQTRSQYVSAVVNDLAGRMNKALNTYLTPDALANSNIMIPRAKPLSEMTEEDLFALGQTPPLISMTTESTPLCHFLNEHTSIDNNCMLTRAGGSILPYYTGVDVSCSDFKSLYSTFLNYYSTNTGLTRDIQTVHTNSLRNTSNMVNAKYKTVLPESLLSNNAYLNNKGTGGVTFYGSKLVHIPSTPTELEGRGVYPADISCCAIVNAVLNNFYGCLPANYLINTITYKMGFGTSNILNFYTTEGINTINVEHNLFLQMNLEQSLNRLDVAGKENYNISNETTSSYRLMLGKIPTRGTITAGSILTTIIQLPPKFESSPLASLDHFTFRFFLDDMVPLDLLFPFPLYNPNTNPPTPTPTDWDVIIQIDEQIGQITPSDK
jgi:hypothetical protein